MLSKKRTISELLSEWRYDEELKERIVHWQTLEGREAKYAPFPANLHPSLVKALQSRGIEQLYTHQRQAFDYAMEGVSFTAVTPTASGKSYCYHLPVLQKIVEDKNARAIYLFPTKALAQDQKNDLNELIEQSGEEILSYTYDGDTAPGIRQKVRKAGHIVMTNPDMLHSGILPHHTKWVSLFENLQYIVIDELHTYKGVFGSHVAHVIRRLKRVCEFYGSKPIFICTSATIKNPKELAEALTNESHALISDSGAPVGKKTFLFYNPPIVHKTFGVRRSAVLEVSDLAKRLYTAGIQTIIFAKSRVRVEMIVTYLKELTRNKLLDESVRGYRGGYLPSERRVIERGLRDGTIQTVVSTNALELGVDIGQLQACIMTGYPGNIASAWQQAGRAGRRQDEALIIYVAQSAALDQYVVNHPLFLLGSAPEEARIYPENMLILMDHLKCAVFELPFSTHDTYGEYEIQELLDYLAEEGVIFKTSEKWHWMSDRFPAHDISLRSASQENVVIIDMTVPAQTKVIGEMDRHSAMTLLHEEAIYLHQGIQFQVEKLDWEEKKAYVREVDVDYYTDANLAVEMKVLEEDRSRDYKGGIIGFGDVGLVAQATIFKKIKFNGNHDNIGSGPIYLPPDEMHTSSSWLSFKNTSEWSEAELTDAMVGAAYAMNAFIPIFIQCDSSDVAVVPQVKAAHNELPTFFVYDKYPGGIGLSEKVYDLWEELLIKTLEHVANCACKSGCPSCIGAQDSLEQAKKRVVELLRILN
ncbi:ATP-dependent helicase [Lysinibacillus sp. KCTC 33748]|uniref:DEAD/DEAH box helicase n=1 Tax=unclassified Lysinibacillus TaxID=2636778 RepID=UPI0009A72689|nr:MULTISPECIES: DEAD/DEAH box helicase [unclassified Lysinibacillus]OXS76125.1 ATP-dependent helicase [Lysinibacillus sp. KCTC 33748]SKB41044.1 DEAD/DEAH box helicase domain-containing protein [Lysinibacillus sp. AC-3]